LYWHRRRRNWVERRSSDVSRARRRRRRRRRQRRRRSRCRRRCRPTTMRSRRRVPAEENGVRRLLPEAEAAEASRCLPSDLQHPTCHFRRPESTAPEGRAISSGIKTAKWTKCWSRSTLTRNSPTFRNSIRRIANRPVPFRFRRAPGSSSKTTAGSGSHPRRKKRAIRTCPTPAPLRNPALWSATNSSDPISAWTPSKPTEEKATPSRPERPRRRPPARTLQRRIFLPSAGSWISAGSWSCSSSRNTDSFHPPKPPASSRRCTLRSSPRNRACS